MNSIIAAVGSVNVHPVLLFLAFAGLWCNACLLFARFGGWAQLARRFRTKGGPCGLSFEPHSGRVGLVNYRRCLCIHTTTEGMYLSVTLLFRLGHPPLFIPWSELHNASIQQILWFERVVCDVGSPVIAELSLPKCIFQGRKVR